MAGLAKVARNRAAHVLTGLYWAQKEVPGTLSTLVVVLEALQIVAYGARIVVGEALVDGFGILVAPPIADTVISNNAHGGLFYFALALAVASVLAAALQVAVANEDSNPRTVGLTSKAAAFCALFWRRLLLPWSIATLTQGFACPSAAANAATDPICTNSSLHTVAATSAGVFMALGIVIATAMESCVFDIDMLSKCALAASHGRSQAVMVVAKAIAACFVGAGALRFSAPVLSLTVFALAVITVYSFSMRAPYASRWVNSLYVAAGSGTGWAAGVAVLPLISQEAGTSMLATFGTALCAAAAFAWSYYSHEAVAKATHLDGTGGEQSALTVWMSIMWVREKLRSADEERRKESAMGFGREARKAALEGSLLALSKSKTTAIEDLVAATSSLTSISTQGGVAAAAASAQLLSRKISRAEQLEKEALQGVAYLEDSHGDHAAAQIVIANFWSHVFSLSHFKERQALASAASLSSAADIAFFVDICMENVRAGKTGAAANAQVVAESSNKDIFDRVRFDKSQKLALEAMLRAREQQMRVMRLVLHKHYDFGSLHADIALSIGTALQQAAAAVEEMLRINSESSHALALAMDFYTNLAGDMQRGLELSQRRNRLLEQQRRQAERRVQHLAFGSPCEEVSPTDEMNAVFTIETEAGRLGEISDFNKAAEGMFGRADFAGANINVIIPQPLASVHDRFLQRFLRTGTARLLDRSRMLVARHVDGSIFPVRFRLFETPASSSDLQPKLTGIMGPVNCDEGFMIVGDQTLDFAVTAGCRRTCDLIGLTGHELEAGGVSAAELFPELFAVVNDDEANGNGRPPMVMRHRGGNRGVGGGGGGGTVVSGFGGRSMAGGKTVAQSVAQKSRAHSMAANALEGVPSWAEAMPRRLQTSFVKPTRVNCFITRPGVDEAPADVTSAAGVGTAPPLVSSKSKGRGGLLGTPPQTTSSRRGPLKGLASPGQGSATLRGVLGGGRRKAGGGAPADEDDDLLSGLLGGDGEAKAAVPPVSLRAAAMKVQQQRRVEEDEQQQQQGRVVTVPMVVRCYGMPRPTPTDPSGVLVCWTRRDRPPPAGGAGRRSSSGPASRASGDGQRQQPHQAQQQSTMPPPRQSTALASQGLRLRPTTTTADVGAAAGIASAQSPPLALAPAPAASNAVAAAPLVAHTVSGASSSLYSGQRGRVTVLEAGSRMSKATNNASSVAKHTAGRDGKSVSSFSSMSAYKTARRRVETLARHHSAAAACLRLNTLSGLVITAIVMALALTVTSAAMDRIVSHKASTLASIRLVFTAEVLGLSIHASAASAEALRYPWASGLASGNASQPSVLDVARADRVPVYEAWPVTSENATQWARQRTAGKVFSIGRTLLQAAKEANEDVHGALTVPDKLCVFEEVPDEAVEAGHFPLELTPLDLASNGSGYVFTPGTCTAGVSMSVVDLIDATVANAERLDGPVANLSAQDFSVRFLLNNAEAVLAKAVNSTVQTSLQGFSFDLSRVVDDEMLILVIVAVVIFLGQALAGCWCSRALAREQRVILHVLFTIPRRLARLVGRVASKHSVDLKRKLAALHSASARLEAAAEDDHEHHEPDDEASGPDDDGGRATAAGAPGRSAVYDEDEEDDGGALGDDMSFKSGGGGRLRLRSKDSYSLHVSGPANGDRAALATAVQSQALQVRRSTTDEGDDKHVPGTAVSGKASVPFQSLADMVSDNDDDPADGEASGRTSARNRRGSVQSLISFDEQTSEAVLRAAVGSSGSKGGDDEDGGVEGETSGGSISTGGGLTANARGRFETVSDDSRYTMRNCACTMLPTLLALAWLVVTIVLQASLHSQVAVQLERMTHALELAASVGRHAHTAGWATVDPSTQTVAGAARTRDALLHRMASERDAIEFRTSMLLHGGPSVVEASRMLTRGWIDGLFHSSTLPAVAEGTQTYHVLVEDACPSILTGAASAFYNSDGRQLITTQSCAAAHDGALARGLVTGLSRFLSRSRALEASLRTLWNDQDTLRGIGVADPSQVNVTAVEQSLVAAHASSASLYKSLLQLADPWLELAATELSSEIGNHLTADVNHSWTLQTEITAIVAVVIVGLTLFVNLRVLGSMQSAIRSARRLLHFLPEAAYKHPDVTAALEAGFRVIGKELV